MGSQLLEADKVTARVDVSRAVKTTLVVSLSGELLRHGLQGERIASRLRSPFSPTEVSIDIASLPYDQETLNVLREARSAGQGTVLKADPADPLVQAIAAHLGLFDRVDASAQAAATTRAPQGGLSVWLRALRLHQWVKNALIFMPLLASHQFANLSLVLDGVIAFIAFGLCASSVYVLNDILDLKDDRCHKFKRFRPFASGALPVTAGLVACPLLLAGAVGLSLALLPAMFVAVLGAYYLLTLSYSLVLKRVMAIDVIVLAMLYTLRIFAGVAALGLTLTFWMLAFAMFLFLSLALAKRYAELQDAMERGMPGKTRGRDYEVRDLEMISSLGAASGYQAVLVLALYVREQSTVALYAWPDLLWLACPVLLFWVTRVWMLTRRGQMHEDPVVFAANDRVSLFAGATFFFIFLLAS